MSKKNTLVDDEQLSLEFITISDQNAIKDPKRQQHARTQAIKNSLRRKRRQLQLTNQNFVNETYPLGRPRKREAAHNGTHTTNTPSLKRSVAASSIDPFSSIAVDSIRLKTLLQHSCARQAGDPVFSVNSAINFQGLQSVFESGLDDGALASALCLVLAFAANGNKMDQECTSYKLKTIQNVNEKLSDPVQAATPSTIGAVLLLVGAEARLGERETTQVHLNGIRQLLLLCNERQVHLNHAIKRAIFWQDLFSSMITGTTRVFSHNTFPELHWHRDPFQAYLFSVPIGFAKRADVLGPEFIEIIGDISGLQRLRVHTKTSNAETLHIEKIDNHQASIESRLEQLRHRATEPSLLSCIPAAYLCAFGFFTDIWSGSVIPSRVTSLLLYQLQASETWPGWEDNADLLLWLLNIGAAFAVDVPVRLGFAGLWHGSHRSRLQPLSRSWEDVEQHLKKFIWSDDVHGLRCGAFWQRLQEL